MNSASSSEKLIGVKQPSSYKYENNVNRNNTEVHAGMRKIARSRNILLGPTDDWIPVVDFRPQKGEIRKRQL